MDISTIRFLLQKIPFDVIEIINEYVKEEFLKIDFNIRYSSVIFSYYGETIKYNLFRCLEEEIEIYDDYIFIKLKKCNNGLGDDCMILYDKQKRKYYHSTLGIIKILSEEEHEQVCKEFEKFKKFL